MRNAASDYDHDVQTGNEDRWGGKRCIRCNHDITDYTDDCDVCAACEEEETAPHAPVYGDENPCEPVGCRCGSVWPCETFAPMTALVKKYAKEHGYEVVDFPLVKVDPADLRGLPKFDA